MHYVILHQASYLLHESLKIYYVYSGISDTLFGKMMTEDFTENVSFHSKTPWQQAIWNVHFLHRKSAAEMKIFASDSWRYVITNLAGLFSPLFFLFLGEVIKLGRCCKPGTSAFFLHASLPNVILLCSELALTTMKISWTGLCHASVTNLCLS